MTTVAATAPKAWYLNRWSQLILGVIAMMAISSPQYVWTLFTGPLNQKLGTTLARAAVDLLAPDHPADLVLAVPGLSGRPLRPAPADRASARCCPAAAGCCPPTSDNMWALYFTYGVLGGFGTGIIYVGIIGLMVRWFPDRRGLATGLAAAGYGFGAVFTSFPIDSMIKSSGYAHDSGRLGHRSGRDRHRRRAMAAHAAARNMQSCRRRTAAIAARQARRSYSPREMLQEPGLLPLVLDDEHDVDLGPHGRRPMSDRSPRNSASPICWYSAWRRCRCRSRCRASPTA